MAYLKTSKPLKISRANLQEIEGILKKSKVSLPFALKLQLAGLILNLMTRRKKFGLFVILGWQNKWRGYTDISDKTQDIFLEHHINIADIRRNGYAAKEIGSTINFDGAILINPKGIVMHSGVILEGLRPRFVAKKVNPGHFTDLSEQLGFKQKVHSRHLFAIAASYTFKNTTVFTLSEETGAFHIFEGGKIIYASDQ